LGLGLRFLHALHFADQLFRSGHLSVGYGSNVAVERGILSGRVAWKYVVIRAIWELRRSAGDAVASVELRSGITLPSKSARSSLSCAISRSNELGNYGLGFRKARSAPQG